jgi:hypothetical protein
VDPFFSFFLRVAHFLLQMLDDWLRTEHFGMLEARRANERRAEAGVKPVPPAAPSNYLMLLPPQLSDLVWFALSAEEFFITCVS